MGQYILHGVYTEYEYRFLRREICYVCGKQVAYNTKLSEYFPGGYIASETEYIEGKGFTPVGNIVVIHGSCNK